jgi:hypothetical protein
MVFDWRPASPPINPGDVMAACGVHPWIARVINRFPCPKSTDTLTRRCTSFAFILPDSLPLYSRDSHKASDLFPPCPHPNGEAASGKRNHPPRLSIPLCDTRSTRNSIYPVTTSQVTDCNNFHRAHAVACRRLDTRAHCCGV